jgi:hypothetical protein
MKKSKIIIYLLFIIINNVSANTIRVPQDYSTIQAAINAAQRGDTVLVSEGTYFENINFQGKGIVVTSNYIFTQDWQTVLGTIINGSTAINKDTASTVQLLNGEDSTSVIEGFTITGGSGTKYHFKDLLQPYQEGGGIILSYSHAVIKDNYITGNINNPVSGGVEDGGGGGIASMYGNPTIINNMIVSNSSGYACGIVLNWSAGTIKNNIIYHNKGGAVDGCGGVMIYDSPDSVVVENNTIAGNVSLTGTGGVSISLAGAYVPDIENNIIWYNRQVNSPQVSLSQPLTFNDVEDHLYTGNISVNPDFADNTFLLADNSPCIDGGDTSSICNDLEDQNAPGKALLPSKGTIRNDIGAYGGLNTKLFPPIITSDIYTSKSSFIISNASTGKVSTLKVDLLNLGTEDLNVDSVTVNNTSLFSFSPNSRGMVYKMFQSDTIILSYNPVIAGSLMDTIRIYHRASSTVSPILIPVKITAKTTDIKDSKSIIYDYKLYQNWPNPFNPSTNIKFDIGATAHVSLKIFDVLGKYVETLIDGVMGSGNYNVEWKPKTNLSSGIYLANLQADNYFETKKMVYLK